MGKGGVWSIPPVTCRGGGEGPDIRHDRVGWGREGYGVYHQLPVEGVEKGLTFGMTE